MNREMYKKERQLPMDETKALLAQGHHGTLAVNGDGGFPYAVPVNYVYLDGFIYMHSAKYGYKMEAIEKDNRVCFSAILSSEIVPDKFTAKFESAIATGTISLVDSQEEKHKVLETFIDRFCSAFKEGGMKFVKAAFDKTAVLKLTPAELTGKAYRGGAF